MTILQQRILRLHFKDGLSAPQISSRLKSPLRETCPAIIELVASGHLAHWRDAVEGASCSMFGRARGPASSIATRPTEGTGKIHGGNHA